MSTVIFKLYFENKLNSFQGNKTKILNYIADLFAKGNGVYNTDVEVKDIEVEESWGFTGDTKYEVLVKCWYDCNNFYEFMSAMRMYKIFPTIISKTENPTPPDVIKKKTNKRIVYVIGEE